MQSVIEPLTARLVPIGCRSPNPFTTVIVSQHTVMMLLSQLGDSAAGQPISPGSAWDC